MQGHLSCEIRTPAHAAEWLISFVRDLEAAREPQLMTEREQVISELLGLYRKRCRQVEQARASHALAKSQSRMTVLCEIFITSAVSSTLNPPK